MLQGANTPAASIRWAASAELPQQAACPFRAETPDPADLLAFPPGENARGHPGHSSRAHAQPLRRRALRPEHPMRAMLAHPMPQFRPGLAVLDLNQRKGQAELLPQVAPVEIDHLGPGAGVDVLL